MPPRTSAPARPRASFMRQLFAPAKAARLCALLLPLLWTSAALGLELERPSLPDDATVNLRADRLIRDERGLITAEGNVRISVGTMHLAADAATYDPEGNRVTAQGRVTVVDGRTVARARQVEVDLLMGTGTMEGVAFFQKEDPQDPAALLEAEEVSTLRDLGRNEVQLHADELVRLQDGSFFAIGPTATICDCDGKADWEIGARSATLSAGDRLNLSWPVFYAKGVPIFASPYFSIPLTNERRTGLLAPNVGLLGRRGPSYEQPLYVVLGHSWDMTLSAGYFFGNSRRATTPDGQPVLGQNGQQLDEEVAFRGPRFGFELRWAPRIGTSGTGSVTYGYDQSLRSPENLEAKRGTAPGTTGYNPHRFGIQLDHVDDWGAGFADRLTINLVSDRNYIRDFTDDIILRGDETLRSNLWVAKRQGQALFSVDATYFQDLRPAFTEGVEVPEGFEESVRLFGSGQRDTFARIPGVAMDLARLSLPGGVAFSAHLGATRFAPLTSAGFGDWGTDGLGPGDIGYPGRDPDGTEADGRLQPGELPAATRLSLRPTLSRPIVVGRFLSVAPYVGWRQELYDYDRGGTGAAGWGVAGTALHTELARDFGPLRHAIIPRVELRTLHHGHDEDAPTLVYDDLDPRPLRSLTQARLALGNRLDLMGREGPFGLDVEVGQDVRITPDAELAETFAQGDLEWGPVTARGLLRWDPRDRETTEASARGALTSGRGDQLRISYRRVAAEGSDRLRAPNDALFGDPDLFLEVPAALLGPLEQIGLGATVIAFEGLTLAYDLLFLPTLETARLLEQRATVAYASPCRCWGGALHFAKRRDEALSVWASLQLAEF